MLSFRAKLNVVIPSNARNLLFAGRTTVDLQSVREREGHDFSRATNPRKIVIPTEVKGLCVFTDHSDPHETL